MPDPEVKWTPNAPVEDATVRARAISAAVLAVSCLVIGIVIGWATAGIPDRKGPRPSVATGVPPAKEAAPKASEPDNRKPSLALQSDPVVDAQKTAPVPSPQAVPKPTSPPVVLLNPGTAGGAAEPNPARQAERSTQRPVRERPELPEARQRDRERQATDRENDVLSAPAASYQSLRRHMLGR
jgi:hypothetical protein